MRKDSNELLFERLLEGDGEALRPLMERHGDACMLYVNGYVHDIVATHITDADQSLANLRYISVPNTLAAEVEGLSEDADGAVAHFYHPGTDNTLMLHQADTQALLYDPVETMSKNGGPDVPTDPDDPTDPKDPKDPKQPEDNKSRRGGMPGTSDPFGGLGLAAAAVGGAAALLAGHSARRVRNERAQQEGEEE